MRMTRLLALGALSSLTIFSLACSSSAVDPTLTAGTSGKGGKGGSGGSGGKGGSGTGAQGGTNGGKGGDSQGQGGSEEGGTDSGSGGDSGSGATGGSISIPLGGSGGVSPGGECPAIPDDDNDKDGWTEAEGDCNDCDANVNPGAIDVVNYKKNEDGTPSTEPSDKQIDEDCDGVAALAGDKLSCDAGLPVQIGDPFDAAKAIGLCNVGVEENPSDPKQRKWGVIQAGFNKIFGPFLSTPLTPQLNAGILDGFGPASQPREGVRLLGMSSGVARAEGQPGYDPNLCGNGFSYVKGPDNWPPGFPKDGTCGETGAPNDGIAYDMKIRVPTNAKSLKFNFRFFSCEYPEYACDQYNDVFAVLMTPSPLDPNSPMHDQGSNSADIAFDEKNNVIGVNNQDFFTACDPSPEAPGYGCVPGGSKELQGTSFVGHGGSAWLATQVPVPSGGIIYLRFAIWDSGDGVLDSSALIDNFQWSAEEGTGVVTRIDPPIQ